MRSTCGQIAYRGRVYTDELDNVLRNTEEAFAARLATVDEFIPFDGAPVICMFMPC